jgi:hypothetical protein
MRISFFEILSETEFDIDPGPQGPGYQYAPDKSGL